MNKTVSIDIDGARRGYRNFITATSSDGGYRLTPRAEPTAYARCFAIFGFQLLKEYELLASNADIWAEELRSEVRSFRERRENTGVELRYDKAYLQLLTFTLSALKILDQLEVDPLEDLVLPLLSSNVKRDLSQVKADKGVPRSGNQAMFMVILLLHARIYLGQNVDEKIELWQAFQKEKMNRFGFWGEDRSMSHLQFQNGYHQYEILEYLYSTEIPWEAAADAVASLADVEGHFAPYPGGGGCYDYDAVFMLTTNSSSISKHSQLLIKTATTLLSEQNTDGGFCESQRIRPRSVDNMVRTWRHVMAAKGVARRERIRQAITLQRPKHDRVHTHWSIYSREWGESDLWDSWFRMLAVARIDVALNPENADKWGFIDYPGIGFHPSVCKKA
ncbi:MAG: hypothetical protein K6L80_04680 [Agarilytica sp.]